MFLGWLKKDLFAWAFFYIIIAAEYLQSSLFKPEERIIGHWVFIGILPIFFPLNVSVLNYAIHLLSNFFVN